MFEESSGSTPPTTKLSRVTTAAGLQGVNRVKSSLPLPILYSMQNVGEKCASYRDSVRICSSDSHISIS